MKKGSYLDGVPVRNMLERNHRGFALRALETLNECLSDNLIPFTSAPCNDPIPLKNPCRYVRDVELRLRPNAMGFAVTHGLHKFYTTTFSDVRSVPVPSTLDELQTLVAGWASCLRCGTSAAETTQMAVTDDNMLHPVIAAATRCAADWTSLEVLPGKLPHQLEITLWRKTGHNLYFTNQKPGPAWSNGHISPALASLLQRARPYVALYRSSWSRKDSINIELGPSGPISADNTFDAMQTFRAIAEACQNKWELV